MENTAWYRNLNTNPQVDVQIRAERLQLVAQDASDDLNESPRTSRSLVRLLHEKTCW